MLIVTEHKLELRCSVGVTFPESVHDVTVEAQLTQSGLGVLLAHRVDGLHAAALSEHAGGGGEMLQGRAVRDRDDQGIELRGEGEYLVGWGTLCVLLEPVDDDAELLDVLAGRFGGGEAGEGGAQQHFGVQLPQRLLRMLDNRERASRRPGDQALRRPGWHGRVR